MQVSIGTRWFKVLCEVRPHPEFCIQLWIRLPWEDVESPSLGILQNHLDTLLCPGVALVGQGGGTR